MFPPFDFQFFHIFTTFNGTRSYRLQQFVPPGDFLFHYTGDYVDDLQNFRMLYGVKDFQPILAPGKNPGSQHQVKVARYGRWRHPQVAPDGLFLLL
jgi:hypothetical protein